MNNRRLHTQVLIIGAGPTGMTAALCLAKFGISSVMVERREGLSVHPKAHEVSARSIEILQQLGFSFEELAAEASPHDDASKILICGTIAEEFGCIDLASGGGAQKYREHLAAPQAYLNISQVEIEKRMVEHVSACPQTQLLWNHSWESFNEEDHGITSRVLDVASGKTFEISSHYVICADGAGSRSRKALGIEMVGPDKLHDVVNAYFQADLSKVVRTRGKLYFICSPKAPGSAFIAHHVEKRWVFHLPIATPHERVEDYTPEVMRQRIYAALGRDDVDIQITSMSHWRMAAQVARRFRSGRAFLAGDAAHRFPPTGGLGMNSGIGDAHNLAWKMALVLQGHAPDRLLDTYERERRPVVQTNCDESLHNFENMSEIAEAFGIRREDVDKVNEQRFSRLFKALPSPLQTWGQKQMEKLGETVLSRYHKNPEVRERVVRAILDQRPHFDRIGLDLGYLYEDGALLSDGTPVTKPADIVSDYIPSTRPGARFPHFWLDGNGRSRSSHSLLDYHRLTLILGAALQPSEELDGLVRVFSLKDASIPLCFREAAHTFCQIKADGALLVRPDGHVAFRQRRGVVLSKAFVSSILEQVLGTTKTAGSS